MNAPSRPCGHCVLVVEDEDTVRIPLTDFLASRGNEVRAVRTAEEALEVLQRGEMVDVVLTDLRLPGADGMTVLREVRARMTDVPVVILTAYGTIGTAVQAIREGAYDFLAKPFDLEEIGALLDRICHWKRLSEENRELRDELRAVRAEVRPVAESPEMQEVLRQARQMAQTDVPLVLVGETGTGKEVLADLIHASGPRRQGRLVKVNCAALPEALFESEMFGHERGAFTGATDRHRGRVEMADGGILFLDEVVDLPATAQTKLLRVLQEGRFERVGSSRSISSDFRLICAAQRDLRGEVEAGRLRQDLYYRIAVLTIEIPPLRRRPKDIPALARHFLSQACTRLRKSPPVISPETLEVLRAYPFPGNVRELKNLMESAAVLCGREVLGPEYLPPWVTGTRSENAPEPQVRWMGHESLDAVVRRVERQCIQDALASCQGRREEAARRLGISRKTLWKKCRELGLSADEGDVTDL